jgi:branched-chain amino acid transport system substrate-binding protein
MTTPTPSKGSATMTVSRYRSLFASVVLALVIAGGCGGQYSDAQRLAAAGSVGPTSAEANATPGTTATGGVAPVGVPGPSSPREPSAAGGVEANGALGAAPPSGRPTTAVTSAGQSAKVAGVSTGAAAAAPGPATASAAGTEAAARAPGAAPDPASAQRKSPVKLGEIAIRSGVLGNIFYPFHEGAVAWVNDVNRRGGLAGHPVDLISVDDGGDPRKAVSLAKRLVEEDKVAAFYAHSSPGTTDAIIPYLEEKNIPMVGSDVGNTGHENTPIFFNPSLTSVKGLMWSHLLPLLTFHPEIKDIAILYCTEIPACKGVNDAAAQVAPPLGYKIVYSAAVTVAQPDYTAEVLAARSAGAKAILLAVDNFSAIRVATAAHRQSYNPVFAIQYSAHAEEFLKQGGTEIEGFVVGGSALHWDHPLNADYRAAYQAYVPGGRGYTSFSLVSWNAGKLLERVAPTWPATPTPADVITSLRALRGETLGGRLPPTTFKPGAPAGTLCGTTFTVKSGHFVSFDGKDEWHCPPGYTPGA